MFLNAKLTFYCNSDSHPAVLISTFLSFHFTCALFPALTQSAALKEGLADPNRISSQRPQPQGCLDLVVHCRTSAAGKIEFIIFYITSVAVLPKMYFSTLI